MHGQPPLSRRDSTCSMGSDYSDSSDYSMSTAPTAYSGRHYGLYEAQAMQHKSEDHQYYDDDQKSVLTYASTTPSEAGCDEDAEYPVFDDDEAVYGDDHLYEPAAIPATPFEFAQCFPSTRRMYISHDDSIDGNMNLRVDTKAETEDGDRVDLTLFHLRMHDLKNRDFSLRRYCRDSGREICHTSRKYAKAASQKKMSSIHQSMSSAFASLRSKSDVKDATRASLKRTDSGYDSMSDDEETDGKHGAKAGKSSNLPIPTNTTNLEFSNYCHLDLKRRGASSSKRYEFNYWGVSYAWRRRVVRKRAGGSDAIAAGIAPIEEISYHLHSNRAQGSLAHIVPAPLTPDEAAEENANGGWVPPCSMWICDGESLKGHEHIADVIIATGLLALVDDSIKNRWHRKDRFRITLPALGLSRKDDAGAARRLIDEVFNSKDQKKVLGNASGRSPLRQIAPKV